MTERKSKGLCYFCDEPLTPEHGLTHKRLHIHVLEVEDEEEGSGPQEIDVNVVSEHDSEPLISMNALTIVANFQTMRITSYCGKKPLHILIDSGNTYNFLDLHIA